MAPKKIATMEEFAATVGLSRPTVSKYFADPGSVRGKTRARIEAGLKRTGFRPNIFAVNLKRRRSKIIGLIVPDPTDPFYMTLAQRIETEATDAGYLALVLSSNGRPQTEARAIETITALNVAGAIIAPLGETSQHARLKVLAREIPLIFVDAPLDEEGPFVGTDNHQTIPLITEYLCRSGDHPTFFETPKVNNNALDRRRAYVSAMERSDLEPRFAPVPPSKSFDFEKAAFEATLQILRDRGFPTRTILCANDRVAFGVLAAMCQSGLKVGRGADCDFRVAGHDNQRLSAYTCPPLTTVSQDCDEMGRVALRMLLARIDGEERTGRGGGGTKVLLKGELVLRKSA
jgi:DNA-binding LacI/PurR family transcriptional regulator